MIAAIVLGSAFGFITLVILCRIHADDRNQTKAIEKYNKAQQLLRVHDYEGMHQVTFIWSDE